MSLTKHLITLLLIGLMEVGALASTHGNLYTQLEKGINSSWVLSAPVLEVELIKNPLLIDFEGRMDYTMPRGGGVFNHHSVRGELHTGLEVNKFWLTYSVGLIGYIAGNDDGIPEGVEGINSLRVGLSF